MLVLTRRLNESIDIGDGIHITLLQVKGNAVSIGIDAPQRVPIRRSEVKARSTVARRPLERSNRRTVLQAD